MYSLLSLGSAFYFFCFLLHLSACVALYFKRKTAVFPLKSAFLTVFWAVLSCLWHTACSFYIFYVCLSNDFHAFLKLFLKDFFRAFSRIFPLSPPSFRLSPSFFLPYSPQKKMRISFRSICENTTFLPLFASRSFLFSPLLFDKKDKKKLTIELLFSL